MTLMDYSDPAFILAAVAAAVVTGLAKGGLALMGALAVPLLALVISPVNAAAVLLPILIASDLYGLWSYRREFDARNLRILIPAGVLGIAIGWATASLVSDRVVGLLVGVVGVAFCFNAWRRRHHALAPKPADVPRGMVWGTLVGFTSFVSHSGGPPYQVYVLPQRLPKLIYAGTTTILFSVLNAVKLIPYAALGQLTLANLRTSLYLVPVALAGVWAGVRLVQLLPERGYFIFVHVLLFAVSVKLIVDGAGI
jgi:uncharacterized membrane protein YfcA